MSIILIKIPHDYGTMKRISVPYILWRIEYIRFLCKIIFICNWNMKLYVFDGLGKNISFGIVSCIHWNWNITLYYIRYQLPAQKEIIILEWNKNIFESNWNQEPSIPCGQFIFFSPKNLRRSIYRYVLCCSVLALHFAVILSNLLNAEWGYYFSWTRVQC